MKHIAKYKSPLGELLLISSDTALSGLWFDCGKHCKDFPKSTVNENAFDRNVNDVLEKTMLWLDTYFSAKIPDFTVPVELHGTDFQKRVWEILMEIPYGSTITYGEIANIIAKEKGISKMSAQAVGQAVGSNKISILIPCHRVLGAQRKLTGYGGGLERKISLLNLEGIEYTV